MTCELRNDARVGGGFDCQFLEDGELVYAWRFELEAAARFLAEKQRADLLRDGWTDLQPAPHHDDPHDQGDGRNDEQF